MDVDKIEKNGRDAAGRLAQVAGDLQARVRTATNRAAGATEKNVRRYPLAATGIAVCCGAVIGAAMAVLFRRRHPTLQDRLHDFERRVRIQQLLHRFR